MTLQMRKREEFLEYSDTLLMFLLKGMRPEKYRDTAPVVHLTAAEVNTWSREQCEAFKDGLPISYIRQIGKIQRQLLLPPPEPTAPAA